MQVVCPTLEQSENKTPPALALAMSQRHDQLRAIARAMMLHERPDHALQPTELVHDAYIRLVQSRSPLSDQLTALVGTLVVTMDRLLAEHGRRRQRRHRLAPHGPIDGSRHDEPAVLSEEARLANEEETFLALEEFALAHPRELAIMALRWRGLDNSQIAEHLKISDDKVERAVTAIRRWLKAKT